MKNKSSKYIMEDSLQILEQIKKVEAPTELYSMTLRKIENHKENVVPQKWIWSAAAVIIFLISFNIRIIENSKTSSVSDAGAFSMMKSQNTFSYE